MKTAKRTVGAAVILCAITFVHPAGAIPNQIGSIGVGPFINPAGMRLEDFAALPATWVAGAKLPGDWEMWHDTAVNDSGVELLRLKHTATVFGVQATDVIVYRRNMKVEKFQIVFQPDKKNGDLGKLEKLLQANASTWSDAASAPDSVKGGSAKFVIESDANKNQSVITVTPIKVVAAAP